MRTNCRMVLVVVFFSTTLVAQPTASPAAASAPAPVVAPANPTPTPSAPPPTLPGVEAKELKVLFGGKTLDGWEYDPKYWTIADGAMHGTGKYGQIFTQGDYGSFRLIVTARVVIPEANTGSGHLGILFWGDRPAAGTWGTAHALQVQPPHGAMWDYRVNKDVKPTRVIPRQALRYHDWHTSEILANLQTGEVRMAVDGIEIIRYRHPDPTLLKRGPIGMQIHSATSVVEYKDIKIEADPKEDRLITVK
ncbi:MAG TPA: DUF1080 domain-containing protein [Opitutaceae bacterium]|nr:DUF1080 domain-containing protein [Opitutaceae bacterium]